MRAAWRQRERGPRSIQGSCTARRLTFVLAFERESSSERGDLLFCANTYGLRTYSVGICVVSTVCPATTPHGHGPANRSETDYTTRLVASFQRSCTVLRTLAPPPLALAGYRSARRNARSAPHLGLLEIRLYHTRIRFVCQSVREVPAKFKQTLLTEHQIQSRSRKTHPIGIVHHPIWAVRDRTGNYRVVPQTLVLLTRSAA